MVSSPPVEVGVGSENDVGYVFFCETGNDAVRSVGKNAFAVAPAQLRILASQAESAAETIEARQEEPDDA
jgi:hypothetical protein